MPEMITSEEILFYLYCKLIVPSVGLVAQYPIFSRECSLHLFEQTFQRYFTNKIFGTNKINYFRILPSFANWDIFAIITTD